MTQKKVEIPNIKKRNDTTFAWTDQELGLCNEAFNKVNGYQYWKIKEYRDRSGALLKNVPTGILLKKDGSPLLDKDDNLIVELPSFSYLDGESALKESIDVQTIFLESYFKDTKSKKNVKFLAPYKLDGWHWNVLELLKSADGNLVSCKKYDTDSHVDPVEDDVFRLIKNEIFPAAQNQQKRQKYYSNSGQIGVNCGLVAAVMMHDLKNGSQKFYDEIITNNITDQELRNKVSEIVENNLAEKFKPYFCRNANNNPIISKQLHHDNENPLLEIARSEILNFISGSRPSPQDISLLAKIIIEEHQLSDQVKKDFEEEVKHYCETIDYPPKPRPRKPAASNSELEEKQSQLKEGKKEINKNLNKLIETPSLNKDNFELFLKPPIYSGIGAEADFEYHEGVNGKKGEWVFTIKEVFLNSPAQKIGLKSGDVIFIKSENGTDESLIKAIQDIRDGGIDILKKNSGTAIFEREKEKVNDGYKLSPKNNIKSTNLSALSSGSLENREK